MLNLHSLGAKLRLDVGPILPDEQPLSLRLCYGNAAISIEQAPRIVWRDCADVGVSFQPLSDASAAGEGLGGRLKAEWFPTIVARDPLRLDLTAHFRVTRVVGNRVLLDTSLSNRHLLRGLRLREAWLVLPGAGPARADLTLTSFGVLDGRLCAWAELDGLDEAGRTMLAQFLSYALHHTQDAVCAQVIRRLSGLPRVGPAVRVETLATAADYEALLGVRLRAYQHADIAGPEVMAQDMADEYDRRSIIMVGKVDGVVVATARLIRCNETGECFLFEEDIPFEALGNRKRSEFLELSRLAVEPDVQGTDIVIKLMKEIGRQLVLNRKLGICLARTTQRVSYAKFGCRTASYRDSPPQAAWANSRADDLGFGGLACRPRSDSLGPEDRRP